MDTILISFNSDAANLYSVLLPSRPPENACMSLNVNKKISISKFTSKIWKKEGAKEIPFKSPAVLKWERFLYKTMTPYFWRFKDIKRQKFHVVWNSKHDCTVKALLPTWPQFRTQVISVYCVVPSHYYVFEMKWEIKKYSLNK